MNIVPLPYALFLSVKRVLRVQDDQYDENDVILIRKHGSRVLPVREAAKQLAKMFLMVGVNKGERQKALSSMRGRKRDGEKHTEDGHSHKGHMSQPE